MRHFRLIRIVAFLLPLLSMLVSPQLSFGGLQAPAVAVQDDRMAEINGLIRDLRDPKFVVRETASKKLTEIGIPAVAALKLAAKSDTLEVQVRANSILSIIQLDRSSGLSESEQATVKQFVAADSLGRVAILREQALARHTELFVRLLDVCVTDEELARSSEDGMKSSIEELIVMDADNSVPQWITNLLITQRWEELNKLLTHPGILKYSPMLRASEARNAGKFDAYVEDCYQRFAKAQAAQETLSTRELVSLTGLLRVQHDFERAEKVVAVLPDVDLQRRLFKELLFQQGNWKEILRRTKLDPAAPEFIPANLAQQALLHHLLGDQAAIAKMELELREQLQAAIEVAGEENAGPAQLLKSDLRLLATVTLNWPLLKEFLDTENLVENVILMAALNRHDEALELLGIGPRFKDRQAWVKNVLQEISETREKLKKSSRRDPDYSRLSQIVEQKRRLLNAFVDIVEHWRFDDEAQLYCQMMFVADASEQEEILDRLIGLGRTKEYWKLVKSLQAKPSGRQRYSSPTWPGITDKDIASYAKQWSSRIHGTMFDPIEKSKIIAAIMNSPWLDREAMDFDLEYEMARLRTHSTAGVNGEDEFLLGKAFELHGQDEAADSLLKQAAQLGYMLAVDAQFFQAIAREDHYGILEYWLGGTTETADRCLLAEEAALKILETETDPEKIKLVKEQLGLCRLAITAQWAGGSYWARRSVSQLDDLEKTQLASFRLQCFVYGVPGDFAHKETQQRQLGNAWSSEGSDLKQQGAIELASLKFDELNYVTDPQSPQSDIRWSFSAIYLNIALGKGMIESKKYDRAVDFLVQTAEFSLGDVSVAEGTVKELAEAGAVKEADQVYQAIENYYIRTLKDYPDSPSTRNNFAWLSTVSNRNLESARRHVSVAVKVRPYVENYWDTVAELEFLLGNPKQAFEASRRCVQLSPARFYYRKQKERFRRAMSEVE